jgi:SAM-dependent methyltransferase
MRLIPKATNIKATLRDAVKTLTRKCGFEVSRINKRINTLNTLKMTGTPSIGAMKAPAPFDAAAWLDRLRDTTPDHFLPTYLQSHGRRLAASMELLREHTTLDDGLLDLACWGVFLPAYRRLGATRVAGASYRGYWESREPGLKPITVEGETFEHAIVDVESDPLPFPDESFGAVVCWELIEHLALDPMFMLAEANRVLKTGGIIHITTPNIVSARSIGEILLGGTPMLYPQYNRRRLLDRHHIEYAPGDLRKLVEAAGFEVAHFDAVDFYTTGHEPVMKLLKQHKFPMELRGDTLVLIGRKVSGVVERHPGPIYE